MPSAVIRRAVPRDLASVASLLELYYIEQHISLRDTEATLVEELASALLGFYVVQAPDGAFLGCVLGHALPSVGKEVAECKRLFVRPEARGQGLADAMLARLESEAGKLGYRWLYLDSLESFTAAVRLYRRRGFEPCPPYPGSDPQASLYFRKALGPGS